MITVVKSHEKLQYFYKMFHEGKQPLGCISVDCLCVLTLWPICLKRFTVLLFARNQIWALMFALSVAVIINDQIVLALMSRPSVRKSTLVAVIRPKPPWSHWPHKMFTRWFAKKVNIQNTASSRLSVISLTKSKNAYIQGIIQKFYAWEKADSSSMERFLQNETCSAHRAGQQICLDHLLKPEVFKMLEMPFSSVCQLFSV